MPTLLERIEINARRRLTWSPHWKAGQRMEQRAKFLKEEAYRLRIQHRAGRGGLAVCRARSYVMDLLLRSLVDAMEAEGKYDPARDRLALVALGGYGRNELNPFSDIDVMFLYPGGLLRAGTPSDGVKAVADGVLYPLWDLKLKVGHSVRNLEDCVALANADMHSKTSLIEARLIGGDEELFQQLQSTILKRCVIGREEEYIQSRVQDQQERRGKYGNSPMLQSPNVKNGCGGLRDFQNLIWMTFFKHGTRSLRELEAQGFIASGDRKHLEHAYDFLMSVRNELHYFKNRAVDVLHRNDQPVVARNLGFMNRSTLRRIEGFMQEYYVHARHVDLITRLVEQRLALLPPRRRLPTFRQVLQSRRNGHRPRVIDGFRVVDDSLLTGSPATLRDHPRRLMRVFLHLQQRGLELHPDLAHHLREAVPLMNRELLQDPHLHKTFLEILKHPGNVGRILRTMHDVGLLGKYLPEFGRLTCLVQHEFYHQYTADEHTLICLERLDQTWDAKVGIHQRYAEIFRDVERQNILYLALLLHDVGKALQVKNHSEAGAEIALRVAQRMGLSESSTRSLAILVRHHLLLAQVSQRLDLDDPAVIREVADKVESPQNLLMLTLHTFSDSLGTSPNLWNDFKDSLLWQLFHHTMDQLIGGTQFIAEGRKRRERAILEVARLLSRSISQDEARAHFGNLPPRYVEVHTPKEMVADLSIVHRFLKLLAGDEASALTPVFTWSNERDRGYTSLKICTWNRHGFFSRVAGAFAAAGMNILSAQIFSRQDGIIIDTFFVVDSHTGKLPKRENRENFEQLCTQSLLDEVDFPALIHEQSGPNPEYHPPPGGTIPTKILFHTDLSEDYTVLEIVTEDHVGLLYYVSDVLARMDLDIWLAKICTEKGAAIDTFYLAEKEGGKVEEKAFLKQVRKEILAALDRMNGVESLRSEETAAA